MFKEIPNGSYIDIPDNAFGFLFHCHIPPVGYGINSSNGKIEEVEIFCRSAYKEEQYWDRPIIPLDYKVKRAKEKSVQLINPKYIDPYLENIRKIEWKRRLCGVWFRNYNPIKKESELIYITGLNYFYITHWKFQGKLMDFRMADRDIFYVVAYCMDDPDCLGLNELTKRKNGKTARVGCWAYERVSRLNNHHAGLQSKSDEDSEEAFFKAVIHPWQKLYDFFRPRYDLMKGEEPSELRFFPTARRGSKAEEEDNTLEEALESFFDYKPATESAFDGPELHTYISDEAGKCFGKGTKIRMYDGTVKNVEDICEEEIVMGDDSTKRNVFGVTNGVEKMYRIVPKKGYNWECNESHILSLKWCTKSNYSKGWGYQSVVNISIKDYLNLKKWEQNHLVLYKKEVEYRKKRHYIDPYFLGLWLGDGTKTTVEITTTDSEIIDYLNEIAEKEGLEISRNEGIRYYLGGSSKRKISGLEYNFNSLSDANKFFGYANKTKFLKSAGYKKNNLSVTEYRDNKILTELHRLNLIRNKHIPNDYLIDSRENRLKLLAGLIDSDGYLSVKDGKPRSFEVTQKLRVLAYQIQELSTSLGYYCSVCPKVAKMKRHDKSVYECMVYRVQIYGDLHLIPTIVERKKAKFCEFHLNRRNPKNCGFQVKSIGVGEYFGFAVDGNNLFLLEDGTVVHNTKKPVSIVERQNIVRFCTEIDGVMQGKHWFTTTVEPEKGEVENYEFQEMTNNSNPLDRNKNNRTGTGLYTYCLPAQKGMYLNEYYKKYGYCDEDANLTFLNNTIESYLEKGDTRGLSSFKRKNPRNFKEAFSADGENSLYDPELLQEQLDEISWGHERTEKGNLKWKDGFKITRQKENKFGESESVMNTVYWESDPKGRWEKVIGWQPKEPNNVYEKNGKYFPNGNYANRIGCDPFKYDKVKDKRRSKCAAFNYQIEDTLNPNDVYNNMFTLRYSFRANSTHEANEDMLLMAWYCGCQILFERNVNHWKSDFTSWGCHGFLMYLPGEDEPGIYTDGTGNTVQLICRYTEAYINRFIKKVFFKTLIRKITGWLDFKVEETQKFDEPMGSGFTLIAVKGIRQKKKHEATRNIESILPYHKIA